MSFKFGKVGAAWLSVFSNTTLVTAKLIIGLLIGSVSVIAEAIHSGVDLFAAIIALFAVKTATLPADKNHPFGHGKVENLSGTIEALLIVVAAIWIIYEAVHKLLNPRPVETLSLGVAIMFVSSAANWFVSQILFKVGKQTDSVALLADGWHLRTDVYTSAGVMVGLLLIMAGQYFAPDVKWHWLDPAVAIGVALLILHAAYRLTLQAGRDLMDMSLPPEEEDRIRSFIDSLHPTVRGYHKLRTRKAGPARFIEFHLLVDAEMTVERSHQITEDLTDMIRLHSPNTSVTIHVEPCSGNCNPLCSNGGLLDEEERQDVAKNIT